MILVLVRGYGILPVHKFYGYVLEARESGERHGFVLSVVPNDVHFPPKVRNEVAPPQRSKSDSDESLPPPPPPSVQNKKHAHRQLWMWINVSSVLWMLLCLAVMIGASITTIPYLAVAIVGACFVLAGLSAAGARLPTLGSLAVSALPFVLVTSVHAVLVFLFALATLDRSVSFCDHV